MSAARGPARRLGPRPGRAAAPPAPSRPKALPPLADVAAALVERARRLGADEVEVSVADGREFDVEVRKGKIETLVEADSRVLGLRVIKDRKTAFASSSDLDPRVLAALVRNAVRRAEMSSPDPFSGLAPLSPERVDPASLDLYDPEVTRLDAPAKIAAAAETERIALADKRITNSYGASFTTHEVRSVLANSNGFLGEYARTYCGLGVGLQAGTTDDRVEDSWGCTKRFVRDLETPEQVARKAVARTVRQLNPRKLKTRTAPVIFEPTQTGWLLGFLFGCVSGTSVYQRTTFLAERLGQAIAAPSVTVLDDALMSRGLGSRPFDSDGLPARRTTVLDKGVLASFLCNTYAARKLGLASTGNADGSGVGPNNFYLEKGALTADEILRSTREGLLLVRTLGHGLNSVTGDISRGAFGIWIEGGEPAYPVSEITISGNLGTLLQGIDAIGSDLDFESSIAGPTVRVAEMTLAGL